MIRYLFITPIDTLTPRGHRQFGAAGSFGEAAMPPAPSVFAGALRSALIGGDAHTLAAFERRERQANDLDFRLTHAGLGRRIEGRIEAFFPLPADLVAFDDGLHRIEPQTRPAGLKSADPLPLAPLLRAPRGKPRSNIWLTESGWRVYLAGDLPEMRHLVTGGDLWKTETRPGIALDGATRTGMDGALFSVEHVALADGIGFIAGFSGAGLPNTGALRLAGDGRAARWQAIDWMPPAASLETLAPTRRFRLILATPGLFAEGWLPTGVDPITRRLAHADFSARLACAAVSRAELVSGWDLGINAPKTAQRAAPAGSVYWFDEFEGKGDIGDKLADWVANGLWNDNDGIDEARRAEGWNRAWLGIWK
ncbi:MAG: type III-B CRISPR module-associated Cmr3 family protein [Rhodocyclaceae bacterium]|nr:type III-B CRISPR module-associated Cmr3 family protein [Rhodocyclaceae bacterium]